MDKEGGGRGGEGRGKKGEEAAHSEQLKKKRGRWEEERGRGGPNMTYVSVC